MLKLRNAFEVMVFDKNKVKKRTAITYDIKKIMAHGPWQD
jgi:hypothetical protein